MGKSRFRLELSVLNTLVVVVGVEIILTSCGAPRNSTSNDASQLSAVPTAAKAEGQLRFEKAQSVFNSQCIRCHTAFATLTEAQFFSQNWAKAGSTSESKIYTNLRGASATGSMPPSSTLSASDRESIAQWIVGAGTAAAKSSAPTNDRLAPQGAPTTEGSPEGRQSAPTSESSVAPSHPTAEPQTPSSPPEPAPVLGEAPNPLPSPTALPVIGAVERFAAAKRLIAQKCAFCHQAWEGYSERDFLNKSTESEDVPWRLAAAGDPQQSAIYAKLKGVSPRPFGNMPAGPRPALNDEDKAILRIWIEKIGTP